MKKEFVIISISALVVISTFAIYQDLHSHVQVSELQGKVQALEQDNAKLQGIVNSYNNPQASGNNAGSKEQEEQIQFEDLYIKAKSSGLPIGKRFRFDAHMNEDYIMAPDYGKQLSYEPAFDDEAQHENALRGSSKDMKTIVASMGVSGEMQVHKVE